MSVLENAELLMDCYRAFSRHDEIFDELIKEACENISTIEEVDSEAKLVAERMKEVSEDLKIDMYFSIWGEIRDEKKVEACLRKMNITKLWPMDYAGNIPMEIIWEKMMNSTRVAMKARKSIDDGDLNGESFDQISYWYKIREEYLKKHDKPRPTNFRMTNELIMAVYHYLSGKGKIIALEGRKIKEEYIEKLIDINKLLRHPLFDAVKRQYNEIDNSLYDPDFIEACVEIPTSNRNDETLAERVLAYELLKALSSQLDDSRLITSVKQFMEASFVVNYVEPVTIRRIRKSMARNNKD